MIPWLIILGPLLAYGLFTAYCFHRAVKELEK